MSGPIALYLNHVEMLDDQGMEWSMKVEEILGSTGRATLTIQDRTMTLEPECHWDVKAVVRSTGFVLWRGEVISEPEDLPVGFPWRRWSLDCADYNNELDWRLVGALDGVTWRDIDGLGDYVNIDPFAASLDTDKTTVQTLLDHYIRVDGTAIETATYVGEYLTDFATLYWSYTSLKQALEDLAAGIAENLQFWIDPDLKFHWVAIPAWQDLAQEAAATFADDTAAPAARGLPELALDVLTISPVPSVGDGGTIGCRDLKFTLDGSSMPEQVYVRGATGYVYNAPAPDPVNETPAVQPPVSTVPAGTKYVVTFVTNTKVYYKDSGGYLSGSGGSGYVTVPAGSTAYTSALQKVRWHLHPSNPTGLFWKILSGPYAGKYIDNDTNYFGYGRIRMQTVAAAVPPVPVVPPPTPDPGPPPFDPANVGVGGSGFVAEAAQDPNRRQMYLQAAISADKSTRDAVGGQVLYRGSRPTLRGSMVVTGGTDSDGVDHGTEGWRVGQLVPIIDSRLPSFLNGRYFVVQRVQTTLIPGQDLREYTLDWGDGPTSRWTMQAKMPAGSGQFPPPAIKIDVQPFDLSPAPNSSQVISAQMVNGSGQPWAVAGKMVEWTLEVYDASGNAVSGQGSIDPEVGITDENGRARTTLTTGATSSLVYFVFAEVPVT